MQPAYIWNDFGEHWIVMQDDRDLYKLPTPTFISPIASLLVRCSVHIPTASFMPHKRFALKTRRYCCKITHFNNSHKRREDKGSVWMTVPPAVGAEEEALSMLEFALSGPGIVAFGVLALFTGVYLFRFAELGTIFKKSDESESRYHVVRVECDDDMKIVVETTNGPRLFSKDGGVETVRSLEEGLALAKAVVDVREKTGRDVKAVVYRVEGTSLIEIGRFPRVGGKQSLLDKHKKEETGFLNPDGSLQQAWDENMRIGASGKIEKEFSNVLKGLTPIKFEAEGARVCKLCGGKGTKRCHRCGGMITQFVENGAQCQLCANTGRLPCEWCRGSGVS